MRSGSCVPTPRSAHWEGERLELGHGLTLIRGGGHFEGGTILHRADGAGALLIGDIIQVIPDRTHVGFMWSYPNLVPLPDAEVQRIAAAVEPFPLRVDLRRLVGRDHPGGRAGDRAALGGSLLARAARRAVSREWRRDVSGVAAARATTARWPTMSVARRARVIAV